jgi:hypothetical protein
MAHTWKALVIFDKVTLVAYSRGPWKCTFGVLEGNLGSVGLAVFSWWMTLTSLFSLEVDFWWVTLIFMDSVSGLDLNIVYGLCEMPGYWPSTWRL